MNVHHESAIILDIRGETLRHPKVILRPWLGLCERGGSNQGEAKLSAPAGSHVPNANTVGAVGILQVTRCAGAALGRFPAASQPEERAELARAAPSWEKNSGNDRRAFLSGSRVARLGARARLVAAVFPTSPPAACKAWDLGSRLRNRK